MTPAEQAAWWLMTFGVGEVPLSRYFPVLRQMERPIANRTELHRLGFIGYHSPTDRPDYYQITEAGIEAINAGN